MTMYEPRNHVEVDTPKGRASIWLVTEYGSETAKVFTCIAKETGEIWEFTNNQIKVTSNITFGRLCSEVLPTHGGYRV